MNATAEMRWRSPLTETSLPQKPPSNFPDALVQKIVPDAPQNLIGDNADDSDQFDGELRQYGIELIAPHRIERKNMTQDLRRLRWKLERLFAWLQNFRRLVVR
jgi:transposase